jgi:hypothetical protein
MANNRDLLTEAIADAKAVKETAIANAKAALEEAFAPRLTSMLSAKLEEMEKEDMDEEIEEVVTTEAKEEVEEAKEDMDEGYGKEDMDEEMDLDEILAELEEGEDKEDMKEGEEIEEAEEAEETETEEEEVEGEEGEDEEIDLEEMSEEDLKDFIEDVIADMVKAGELEAGEEFEAEDEEVEGDEEIEVEDEAEEIMEGEKEEMDEAKEEMDEGMMDKLKAIYNDPEVLGKLITVDGKKMSLKDFLAMAGGAAQSGVKGAPGKAGSNVGGGGAGTMEEADEMDEDIMAEINSLKAELQEVNLLNAKLLYTNKLFRANSLKESQKVKVLEAFDKAKTVKEAKLIFETLSEGMTARTATPIKENLGRASKAAGMAPKRPIVEVDSQVARWQKLAGIK